MGGPGWRGQPTQVKLIPGSTGFPRSLAGGTSQQACSLTPSFPAETRVPCGMGIVRNVQSKPGKLAVHQSDVIFILFWFDFDFFIVFSKRVISNALFLMQWRRCAPGDAAPPLPSLLPGSFSNSHNPQILGL